MTATQFHDHTERVQGEVTAAVQRLAEAQFRAYESEYDARHMTPADFYATARADIAVVLDVEEMAAEADRHYLSGYDGGNTICNCGAVVAPGHRPRHIATAIRAALLGGAS